MKWIKMTEEEEKQIQKRGENWGSGRTEMGDHNKRGKRMTRGTIIHLEPSRPNIKQEQINIQRSTTEVVIRTYWEKSRRNTACYTQNWVSNISNIISNIREKRKRRREKRRYTETYRNKQVKRTRRTGEKSEKTKEKRIPWEEYEKGWGWRGRWKRCCWW